MNNIYTSDYEFVENAIYPNGINNVAQTYNFPFIIFILVLLVVLILIFKWLFSKSDKLSEHLAVDLQDSNTNVTVNIEKYIPDYWGLPYRRNLWYDQYTPFIWNNSGRIPSSWGYPPYARIADYYRYGYPYLYSYY